MTEADRLAEDLFEARRALRRAGRALHDDVGYVLSALGLRLQLLRMDHPQAGAALEEIAAGLDQALERVRGLSRELNGSPAASIGLERALLQLAEERAASFPGTIQLTYSAKAALPPDAAAAMYGAVAAALDFFVRDKTATRVAIAARGSKNLTVRAASNGRTPWKRAEIREQARLARPAGIVLEALTKRGTIVSLRYAAGRSAGG